MIFNGAISPLPLRWLGPKFSAVHKAEHIEVGFRFKGGQPGSEDSLRDDINSIRGQTAGIPLIRQEYDSFASLCRKCLDHSYVLDSHSFPNSPGVRPMTTKNAAGFPLRLPRSMHDQATQMAKNEGISLNQLITLALAEKMVRLDAGKALDRQREWSPQHVEVA